MAYTPGLAIKTETRINRKRLLPTNGKVLVKKGDEVRFDTVVARALIPGRVDVFQASGILGVYPDELERFMLKKVGDPVEENEVIGLRKSLFGLNKSLLRSPAKGTIELISKITGQAAIRHGPISVEVKAYISGKVSDVLPRKGAVIVTNGSFIQGIFGIGGETHGQLAIIADSTDDVLTAGKIQANQKGKILVGGSLATKEAIRKAISIGVKGIVAGGMEVKALRDLLGYEIGVAITGNEKLGLTLILTEGFGKMNMSNKVIELLRLHDGKQAMMNGATQIRAGVMRPEIVIPLEKDKSSEAEEVKKIFGSGMKIGMPVRIIRDPYFGALGEVASLPAELHMIETGSLVRVVKVKLENGRIVTIPRANVEMIET